MYGHLFLDCSQLQMSECSAQRMVNPVQMNPVQRVFPAVLKDIDRWVEPIAEALQDE